MERLEMLVPLILIPFTLAAIYGVIWPEAIQGQQRPSITAAATALRTQRRRTSSAVT